MKVGGKILWVWMVVMLGAIPGQTEIVNRIVAVVNDEVITVSEMNEAFDPYKMRIIDTYKGKDQDKVMAETRMAMLGKLIDNVLIEQEAKKAGLNTQAITDCFNKDGISLIEKEVALTEQYKVQGSPTLLGDHRDPKER